MEAGNQLMTVVSRGWKTRALLSDPWRIANNLLFKMTATLVAGKNCLLRDPMFAFQVQRRIWKHFLHQ